MPVKARKGLDLVDKESKDDDDFNKAFGFALNKEEQH